MDEIWKPIPRFGRYEVSDRGCVRVAKPDVTGRHRYIGHIVSQHISGRAKYLKVVIRDDEGRPKNLFVHHAVAAAFIGPRQKGEQTNHRDGDKTNNWPSNLEYLTAKQNYRHALDVLGFRPPRGENHWSVTISDEQVAEIVVRARAGEPQAQLAAEYGCAPSVISRFKHGLGRAARLYN